MGTNNRNRQAKNPVNMLKGPKVAVFIDNENAFYGSLKNAKSFPIYTTIMEKCKEYGLIVSAEGICDWTRMPKGISHVVQAGMRAHLSCHALTAYSTDAMGLKEKYFGKQSSSDGEMYSRVYKFERYHPEVDVYVLVTGDRDFLPLVHDLREFGHYVVVLSEEKSLAKDLQCAANEYATFQEIGALQLTEDGKHENVNHSS